MPSMNCTTEVTCAGVSVLEYAGMAPRPVLIMFESWVAVCVFQAAGGMPPWQPAQLEAYS